MIGAEAPRRASAVAPSQQAARTETLERRIAGVVALHDDLADGYARFLRSEQGGLLVRRFSADVFWRRADRREDAGSGSLEDEATRAPLNFAKRLRKDRPELSTPVRDAEPKSLREKGLSLAGTQGFEPQ